MNSPRSDLRWWRSVIAAALAVAIYGCTPNPLIGKWQIEQRSKETNESYLDRLSSNIRTSTGARMIEFRRHSILVTGGTKNASETGIKYRIQELENGGTEVRIFQPGKDDPHRWDIDVCRVDSNGQTAQLESKSELVQLKRMND